MAQVVSCATPIAGCGQQGDFGRVAETMAPPRALVDARNLLDPAAMRRRGFAYQGVGR